MTFLFSQKLNFDHAAEIPPAIVDEVSVASKSVNDPETAKALFEKLTPLITKNRPSRSFSIACGLLMEKQRSKEGMLEFWQDLLSVFPNDLTALRMLMRWHRRERKTDTGVEFVQNLYPASHTDEEEASLAIIAFGELRAFREVDEMVRSLLKRGSVNRTLKMRYLKLLSQQGRYVEAKSIADTIENPETMGQSSKDLIAKVTRRAAKLENLLNFDSSSVFRQIVSHCPLSQPINSQTLGNICFFTGQLGTGGAEKQLSFQAIELNKCFTAARRLDGIEVSSAPSVCVIHTDPASGGDFYVPTLRREGIRTNVLSEMRSVVASEIPDLNPNVSELLELLPEDVAERTRKLILYFQAQGTKVAYLWQDGGVLSAAIAALIAGVPRIVTSFRGLPPNLRPNLMRPELKPLYKVLFERPEVSFTANSKCSATAYEEWLELPNDSIDVIPNAIAPMSPKADGASQEQWERIANASPNCRKTVIGVFRFDENKRPLLWIEMARDYAQENPDTRFVILGSGHLLPQARDLVSKFGMQNQIFLVGVQKNVGFFLNNADVLLHLARQEGLPNVLIEAHLAGKPVIATPAGGTSEIVDHRNTGYILTNTSNPSVDEVLLYLSNLLGNPKTMRRMGQVARALSTPKYLPENVLSRTAKLILNLKD